MKASIIVCTHNRCDSLRETLQSLTLQDYPVTDYEVVVVDNSSADRTKECVHEFIERHNGLIRYVFEESLGLSHARNRGIKEADGEIICFIDDDAMAEKSWLSKLINVYREENDVACTGGRVLLDWRVPEPAWWCPELDEVFNGINYSDRRIALEYPRFPYGTNISFSSSVLREVGLFETDLGRIGSRLLAGEETELCLKIEKGGHKIYYEPCAIVYHKVEPEKLTKSYIRKRAIWHGRSFVLIELRHFGQKHVTKQSLNYCLHLYRWIKRGRYPLIEQKNHLFIYGYFFQWLLLKLKFTGLFKAA